MAPHQLNAAAPAFQPAQPQSPTKQANAKNALGIEGSHNAPSVDFVSASSGGPSIASSLKTLGVTPLKRVEQGLEDMAATVQKSVGWRRHALQRFTLGGGALGLVLACCGHPWGLVFAAVGMLAGAIVQHAARGRALEQAQTKDFLQQFDAVRAEHLDANGKPFNAFSAAVVQSDAFIRGAKLHAFLRGGFVYDLQQAFVAPVAAFVRQVRGPKATSPQDAAREALADEAAEVTPPDEVLHPAPPAPAQA